MKQFTLFIVFAIEMISIQPMYSNFSSNKQLCSLTKKQSMTNRIYSYLWQQYQQESIPAAKDSSKKVIIFDLDGVLCTTNNIRAFQEIGMAIIWHYMLEHLKSPSSLALFQALEFAPALTTYDSYNEGVRMPQCMVDWQVGAQELRDIQDGMVAHILASNLTISEKNLHVQTILMMTTPAKFIASRQIIPDGIELARTLKKLGYKLYILSNWDPTSFPLFMEQFPELFTYEGQDLFDGIMTSGQQHILKPNKEIYQACLKKFDIQASQAVFIDDTIENIQSAEDCGIQSIHCKNKNIFDVKKQLLKILA